MLALFGVGDFRGQRGETGGGQLFPDGVPGQPQRPGVDDQDALDALAQQARQACQEAAAHYDVVVLTRRLSGDFDDG